jgi:hypothetical protein
MTEDFLHFVWKYGLFVREGIIADTGDEIRVFNLGEHNMDAGPDFLNTRIQIGNTTWAGNVEIHLKSSDWQTHKHHRDKAYDNVILHVVFEHNQPVYRSNGEAIPTVGLRFDPNLYNNYCRLLSQKSHLPCHEKIGSVDSLIVDLWISSLVIERLQQKTSHIAGLLEQYRNNWDEVFYICLARSFGFGLNAMPFEMLARSVPLSCLMRHRDNTRQLEAMLLGQAGFLEEGRLYDDYYTELREEYLHLKNKYHLRPLEKHLWKFLRLRPVNFPTIRIAQFASVLQQSGIFSHMLACSSVDDLKRFFSVKTSEYWDTHYNFESGSVRLVKRLGKEAFHTLVINTVIPFMFQYGRMTAREDLKDKALGWLQNIPAENNRYTKQWASIMSSPDNAFYSQGILQLLKEYCSKKRCLACSVGSHIITRGL